MTIVLSNNLPGLRNTHDLRAEILALASMVAAGFAQGVLVVEDRLISQDMVMKEWEVAMAAFTPLVRVRMKLRIEGSDARG